jgi:hypothetical protein
MDSETLTIGNAGSGTLEWSLDVASPGCALPAWLDATPASGSLAASASEEVDLALDTGTLPEGAYSTSLCIASNDAGVPLVEIGVNLEVEPNDRIFGNGFDGP